MDKYCGESDQPVVSETVYLHVYAWEMTLL